MANRAGHLRRWAGVCTLLGLLPAALASPAKAQTPAASVSAWEAAEFRSWTFIPNWTSQAQIDAFRTDRVYDHVSDVLYAFGVQPKADGSLFYTSASTNQMARLKSDQAMFGFRYHMCMFTVNGGATDTVWETITASSSIRATFVNNVKNLLAANNMTGMNLDWERPSNATEWGNYTQLAREMQAAFPASWEVSVDDYGSADGRWNDSPLFSADAFDQVGLMAYHYAASSQANWANTHTALGFSNSQLILGMGTWGVPLNGTPSIATLKSIAAANPQLAPDVTTYQGTVNGVTGTWDIVSRYEVRDNVQLALNRGMPGVMWWALQYDATNKLSLAQVAQHYAMVKTNTPDMTLDGKVDAADANRLADNLGTNTTATGTATPAQFESFYMNGNWEKGDRDGNGFINQADADWLAGRYAALNVALPDRLAYSGTFEKLPDGVGLDGRWAAVRGPTNQLPETSNFIQHNAGFLAYGGTGPGATKHATTAVTFRNQNAAEAAAAVNAAPRQMSVALDAPIDLGAAGETYISFLVRANTAGLLPSQIASPDRTLVLELQDASGAVQYDFAFKASQAQIAIRSQADAAGEDVAATALAANATYMFVAKISGNGAGASTLQATLFNPNASIGNFTEPGFNWGLTAQGGADFNPTITQLQFTSLFENNMTVSNVWIGSASDFFAPPLPGDFNADGTVSAADLELWSANVGMETGATHWQGDANADGAVDGADFLMWQRHLGMTSSPATGAVPEPTAVVVALAFATAALAVGRRAAKAR